MKTPIIHKPCGATVMYWVADRQPVYGEVMRASDVELLDGSHPKTGSLVGNCPNCGMSLQPREVHRVEI